MSLNFKYTTTLTDYDNFENALQNYISTGDVNKKHKYNFYLSISIRGIVLLLLIILAADYLKWGFDIASFLVGYFGYILIAQSAYRKYKSLMRPKENSSLCGEDELHLTMKK